MKSFKFILISLFLSGILSAEIRVTSKNIKSFKVVNVSPAIGCYLKTYSLGTLSSSKIKIGTRWNLTTAAKVEREIVLLRIKIAKASKKNKKSLNIKLAALLKLKKAVTNSVSKCRNPASTPVPTPTPIPPTPIPTPTPLPPGDGQFVGAANSLDPYRDNLTEDEVQHILRKVAFGGNPTLENIGKTQGLTALVNALVDGDDQEESLMSKAMEFGSKGFYYREELPNYPIYTPDVLRAAQVYRFIYSPKPFKEWMLMNLSGHFSVNLNRIGFAYSTYSHSGMRDFWSLLINNSMGSFRDLTQAMLTDKAMNFWLDNKDNHVGAPNQNFGRELLELMILGRTDPVTHLSNYEENSVVAATGFLSGYYEDAVENPQINDYSLEIKYQSSLHDNTPRSVFSSSNLTFTPAGFINHVLDTQPGAPRFIAERFAGMMLYPGLPENIVADLANILKSNNYQLKPFYKTILKSQAFFSNSSRGSCFSSPLEQLVTLARKIYPDQLTTTGEYGQRAFYALLTISEAAGNSGQTIFEPPSIFGWKGSCNINRNSDLAYGEGWIKTQRLLGRINGCSQVLNVLGWYGVDYLQTLGISANATPVQISQLITKKISNTQLLPAEEALVIEYLRHFKGENYDYYDDPDLTQEWVVMNKIPRTVCMIYGLGLTNFR